ncbi:Uncharacterised protein (plasmid) [Tsukamurella tyrosinosolvens]|uniref:Uncharacterized protein n=1 Tax=Tsukamurella tyrosinosolvens TaxID=57704 RepID=A0A1H5AYQ9_TSUTY|nr:hypothetical protein [Tsukamurella tyrosinosolvens]KXO95210.1 hypothetical protein AXK58_10770 [Tsukamurella tyrosinosolvens]SED47483.1 hypothetical protein SAMN04489793_5047 [Tsukamurella tyrosinosolvens]VEH88852.1 Uncharacterised protein [Tsukamurella tyrosinosolvens]
MSNNGFGKYLSGEQTDAQRRATPGYKRGVGRYLDPTTTAANEKREQLAQLRRQRIRESIDAGTVRYEGEAWGSKNGAPIDPLTGDEAAIEKAWRDEFGGDAS